MPSAYSQLSNKPGVWVNLFVYYMKKCVEGVQNLGKQKARIIEIECFQIKNHLTSKELARKDLKD